MLEPNDGFEVHLKSNFSEMETATLPDDIS